MNIVLLGPPGTGKGTVAQYIEKNYGYRQLSTGDLLREEVKKGSDLGRKVEPIMKAGKLVDDKTVAEIVAGALRKGTGKGIVLDGFPRNLSQAKMLDEMRVEIGFVMNLESKKETVVRRLSSRRQCPGCNKVYGLDLPPKKEGLCDVCGTALAQREDDRAETVAKRYELYRELADPRLEFYRKKGLLKEVNGNLRLEEVYRQASEIIDEDA